MADARDLRHVRTRMGIDAEIIANDLCMELEYFRKFEMTQDIQKDSKEFYMYIAYQHKLELLADYLKIADYEIYADFGEEDFRYNDNPEMVSNIRMDDGSRWVFLFRDDMV